MRITVLGKSPSWQDAGGACSGYLVQAEGTNLLLDAGNGVLVLTDMFGGTPTNIAASFLGQVAVEIVTGVNLPMVIKVATQEKDEPLAELARRVCQEGQQQIHVASDILTPHKK